MTDDQVKILLIEDNQADARLIRVLLSRSRDIFFEVEHAPNLAAGLARLSRGDIDMVLLDLMLPDSRDLETFDQVYAHDPDVPVVVLSGLSDVSLGIKAVQEGAQDYLVKGEVDGPSLERSIRYSIERQRMRSDQEHATMELQAITANFKCGSGLEPMLPLMVVGLFALMAIRRWRS